jgi:NAD(P)-dependent dehydrogenase (short-subunit alcohol dehydrogenase family)
MKKALIIGASRGIGLGFVRQLCQLGLSVIATARQFEDIKALELLGAKALALDVRHPQERERFLQEIKAEEFSLIVHVAGVYGPHTNALSPVDQGDFDSVMQTNLAPVLFMLPQLMKKLTLNEGRWVSISSQMASISLSQDSAGWLYKVSKAALNMAVHAASKNYHDQIIVAMSPGWVKTDMGSLSAPLTVDESVGQMLKTIQSLSFKDSGHFINYDGQQLTW